MSKRNFRCIHCGDQFVLSDAENEDYENGFFSAEPDCCDDCICNVIDQDYEQFSDADTGL